MNSKVWLFAGMIVPVMVVVGTGCLVPGRYGQPVLLAPPLPSIVVFDTEPYYVQEGYHYHYQNDGWSYSRSRSGPWTSLPRDRYPKEIKYKNGAPGQRHVSPLDRRRLQSLPGQPGALRRPLGADP